MDERGEMTQDNTPLAQAAEDLFNHAMDREDVKWLLARLPEEASVARSKVEYELQILKFISVGWSIAYVLEDAPQKAPLCQRYWEAVQAYAQSLSETTGLMIGQDIDYFQVLKQRLEEYVQALADRPDANEPAVVIGPEFAHICGNRADLFVEMAGANMFLTTVRRVEQYLGAIDLP